MRRAHFRILFRHFLTRGVDPDMVGGGGETTSLASNLLGILLGLGFTIALLWGMAFGNLREPRLFLKPVMLSGDQHFMALLTFFLGALTAAVTADSMFPDRRDAFSLGPLPVRRGSFFTARLASLALYPLVVAAAVNLFPALVLGLNGLNLASHLAFVLGAGLVPFAAFVVAQSAMVLLLPERLRLRLQAAMQIVWTFGALAFFQLAPDVNVLPPLAALLPALTGGALVLYALAFPVALRAAIAGAPSRGTGGRLTRVLSRVLTRVKAAFDRVALPDLRERAVFWFIARTMARSPKHRLLMGLYAAAGFSFVIAATQPSPDVDPTLLMLAPMNLAFFLVCGVRGLAVLPVELQANWLFRLTERGPRRPYFRALRKFTFWCAVLPAAVIPLPFFVRTHGPAIAVQHALFVVVMLLILQERLLKTFQKIPFTCSYQPGKANVKVRLGWWIGLYVFGSWLMSAFLLGLLHAPRTFPWVLAALAGFWVFQVVKGQQREDEMGGVVYDDTRDTGLELLLLAR